MLVNKDTSKVTGYQKIPGNCVQGIHLVHPGAQNVSEGIRRYANSSNSNQLSKDTRTVGQDHTKKTGGKGR